MKRYPLFSIIFAAAAATTGAFAQDYQYSGPTGPGFWKETPGWEACGRGALAEGRQTPINIVSAEFDRRLSPLSLRIDATPVALVNNGHKIELEYQPGSIIVVDGASYELRQFHFHTLSEHALASRRGAAELHAVFRDPATGRLAVVGQLFDLGAPSPFLRTLFAKGVPTRSGDRIESDERVNVREAFRNIGDYYTYEGSLTTPPCSEVVRWFVLAERTTLSQQQYDAINGAVGNNFRPLQPRNARQVRASRPGPIDR